MEERSLTMWDELVEVPSSSMAEMEQMAFEWYIDDQMSKLLSNPNSSEVDKYILENYSGDK